MSPQGQLAVLINMILELMIFKLSSFSSSNITNFAFLALKAHIRLNFSMLLFFLTINLYLQL